MRTQGLRQRIEIQEQISTEDTSGDIGLRWVTVEIDSTRLLDAVPARVLTGPGKAQFLAQQQQDDVAARIFFRYKEFTGLTAKHRIIWNGRPFDIIGEPDLDETAQREWRVTCRAGMNDG
jgi:SPP1 family predicted phage head-tail adaptor